MLLCPKVFGSASRTEGGKYDALRAKPFTGIPFKKVEERDYDAIETATAIEHLQPTASTMFHELLHLILGHKVTVPRDNIERYEWADIAKLAFEDAVRNAHTFTLAAIAYDYTLNADKDEQGNRVEFFLGFATYG
jgi:hypothetical protein